MGEKMKLKKTEYQFVVENGDNKLKVDSPLDAKSEFEAWRDKSVPGELVGGAKYDCPSEHDFAEWSKRKIVTESYEGIEHCGHASCPRFRYTEDTEEWPVCVRESHCHVCSVWLRRVVASEARLRKILEVLGVWLADNDLDGQVLCETGIDLRKEQKHE